VTGRLAALALVASSGAAVPVAAEPFAPDRSLCTPTLTVQKRLCEVERVFRCSGPDGDVYRSEVYDRESPFPSVTFHTADGQMYLYLDPDGIAFLTLIESEMPFSRTELLGAGTTEYISTLEMRFPFFADPIEVSYSGNAKVVDHEARIGDVAVIRFRHTHNMVVGLGIGTISGHDELFYEPQTSSFFTGISEMEMLGKRERIKTVPVDVLRPGDAGFDTDIPIHDCGELSRLDPPFSSHSDGASHDHL
jgi:hypothetical protein